MYARVVTIHARPEALDECVRIFRDVNAPSIARQPGFDHGHWWVDRTTGKATSVTFWDTAEHERASRANVDRLVDGMAHVLASRDVEQEAFERVHDEDGAGARDGRPVAVAPRGGATVQGPVGGPLTFKVRAEDTGGRLTALENVIPPGQGPPLHRHAHEDEAWQVLEGDLRFRLGDEVREAPAGTFVFVPRGVPHCFQCVGAAPARVLVLFTPSGMERFFDRFAELPGDADPAPMFGAIGRDVGMEVVGPPLAVSHPPG